MGAGLRPGAWAWEPLLFFSKEGRIKQLLETVAGEEGSAESGQWQRVGDRKTRAESGRGMARCGGESAFLVHPA